jgi:hypothetical protein
MGLASSLNDKDRSHGLLLDVASYDADRRRTVLDELMSVGLTIHEEQFGRPDLRPGKGGGPIDADMWIKIGIGFSAGPAAIVVAGFLQELGKDLYTQLKSGIVALRRHASAPTDGPTIEVTLRRGPNQWVLVTFPPGDVAPQIAALDAVAIPASVDYLNVCDIGWDADSGTWQVIIRIPEPVEH